MPPEKCGSTERIVSRFRKYGRRGRHEATEGLAVAGGRGARTRCVKAVIVNRARMRGMTSKSVTEAVTGDTEEKA